ncbi:MAG: hypothetical protein K2W95_29300 [Candidatus Obscuribacterales bacterium]|nr:hypothetical protein [Candidatus Obscuribacterales bacterium]
MDSGDMLKQLLDKFTVEESVIQEELKLVQEQIDQLESRLGECSTSRDRLSVDRERVIRMMQRYVHGKFEPPPEVLARLDTIAAEALARFDSPSGFTAAAAAVTVSKPATVFETPRPTAPPAPVAPSPAEQILVAPEPEAPSVQPVPAAVPEPVPDIEPGRQTLRMQGVTNPVSRAMKEFTDSEIQPMPDLSDEPATVEWDDPVPPPPPPLHCEEVAEPVAPPLEAPPQPVAADSSLPEQEVPASAVAADNTNQGASSVDFGGEEEADLKSINDALRSLFR